MWFNNALLFHYELDKSTDIGSLLSEEALKPCPPHARFTYGWMPIFESCFAHEIAGATLICLGKEERILPRSVILRELEERVIAQEGVRLRPLKRSEKSQLAEEIEFELLPKAFCLQKRLYAIFDHTSNRIIVNTASSTQAEQFTALLRKVIPNISITLIPYHEHLATRFAEWIKKPTSIPPSLQLASDCLLFSPDDEKKRFNCKGYELPADEVVSLLTQGLMPAEVSVQWSDHIQFTLTQDLAFKRIKCMDYLVEEFVSFKQLEEDAAQRDAELTLLSMELRSMFNFLLKHLSNPPKETTHIDRATTIRDRELEIV